MQLLHLYLFIRCNIFCLLIIWAWRLINYKEALAENYPLINVMIQLWLLLVHNFMIQLLWSVSRIYNICYRPIFKSSCQLAFGISQDRWCNEKREASQTVSVIKFHQNLFKMIIWWSVEHILTCSFERAIH